ncbi:MAG: ceramidase domain-containing protein [Deltaproteobacteria bacterium]|nr:ceramidase domain-containing protein [Deltaproteobacteria bacterium]
MENACPWDPWRAVVGVPNLDWCEASTCAWIDEPANTWSNVAYLLAAALILWRSRQKGEPLFPLARLFPTACLVLGLCSFAYHASLTFALQVFDFVGMFGFLYIPVTINLRRLDLVRNENATYVGLIAASVVLLFVLRVLGAKYQLMIALGVVLLLASEAWAARRSRARGPLTMLAVGVGFLIVAATFSGLDLARVFCDPNDHVVQGHAIWHLCSATALVFCHEYYAGLALKA